MKRIPGDAVRRVLAVSAVVALASVSACGGGTSDDAGGSSASPSPSPSASASDESAAGEPGAAADGECGGGDFETQVVKAAQGVQLKVPATWRVTSGAKGADVRLVGPGEADIEGQMVVEDKDQSLEQAIKDVERLNSTTRKVGEQDLQLSGFEASKLLVFEGKDYTDTTVVAVGRDGLRVIAYVIVEGAPEQHATVESCLSSVSIAP